MGTRIYYLRDTTNIRTRKDGTPTRGNPRVCIVSEFNSDTKEVKYGIASLHPKDHFDKKLARKIAEGRMTSKPVVLEANVTRGHEINKAVIKNIAETCKWESNLKQLANLWLDKAEKPVVVPVIEEQPVQIRA